MEHFVSAHLTKMITMSIHGKCLENIILWNQKVNNVGSCYVALGCWVCMYLWGYCTGIIPFSDCGEFAASLVSGVVSFMVEGRVGSVKGLKKYVYYLYPTQIYCINTTKHTRSCV